MANSLPHYKSKLSVLQATEGINVAIKNSRRLYEDSKRLLDAGSFPTATSLAVLAIEEAGKVSILRRLLVEKDDKARQTAWREYRSHTKKNVMAPIVDFLRSGARKLEDFAPLYDPDAHHPLVFDQLKQLGFYTDCLADAHWSDPVEVIDESLARAIVLTANILSRGDEKQELELELWVKHIGPVWRSDSAWMQKATEDWYEDMQKHGLIAEGPNRMREFIRTGLTSTETKT